MFGGLTQATSQRMQKCLDAFQLWLRDEFSLDLEFALASSEHANLSLRAYGRWLYERGSPRYHFVYCVTAVQRVRPEFKGLLGGAWHVDRMWQLEEPGQCRAVLSSAMVRAIICLGLLWGWRQFVGVISLGFGGMLHPNEFVHLCRQDLVFPEDALTASSTLYVHIRSPKTARFARKQHARIDDPSILHLARQLFFDLPLGSRLFDASLAVFRRQWNHLLDFLSRFLAARLSAARPQASSAAPGPRLCISTLRICRKWHGEAGGLAAALWSTTSKRWRPNFSCIS